jgi:hypothetical protein
VPEATTDTDLEPQPEIYFLQNHYIIIYHSISFYTVPSIQTRHDNEVWTNFALSNPNSIKFGYP